MSNDFEMHPVKQHGFSLVEAMIGLAVGMVAALAIFNTFSVYEYRSRATLSGAASSENGSLVLSQIVQDIRRAGSGFNNQKSFSCANLHSNVDDGNLAPGAVSSFSTTSVSIVEGVGTGSDAVVVRTASNFMGAIPTLIATGNGGLRTVDVVRGYDIDVTAHPMLAMLVQDDSANCMLAAITSTEPSGVNTKLHFDVGVSAPNPEYNVSNAHMTSNGWPLFDQYAGGQLFVLGKINSGAGITSRTYSVDAQNRLMVTNSVTGGASTNEVLATDVVAFQAQYGISSTPINNTIISWVNPVGSWATAFDGRGVMTTQPTPANIQLIKAIRLVVVTRNNQKENTAISTTCTANHAANTGPCAYIDDSAASPAPAIDLSANSNWQNYRYQVFQTIVPLRNVMWMN